MTSSDNVYVAELSLLASVLLDPQAFHRVHRVITEDSFSDSRHARMWHAIEALDKKQRPIEPVALTAEMESLKTLESIGGRSYLTDCMAVEYSSQNAPEYARIVSEASDKRRLWALGKKLCIQAADAAFEASAVTLMVKQELDAITAKSRVGARPVAEVVSEIFPQLIRGQGSPPGLMTGFRRLDEATNGLQPGQSIIIAARPSIGKSTFAQNIASHAALKNKKHVLFFSLEMPGQEVGKSLIAATSGIDVRRLKPGALEERFKVKLIDAARVLSSNDLMIADDSAMTLAAIRAEAMALHVRRSLDLVIVDYLQLIGDEPKGRYESNQLRIAGFSKGLKALAKDLNVPVILLCQLNREMEKRENGSPSLADLRDSGSLEQDADLVLALHRPLKEDEKNPAKTVLTILKQRTGERNVFIPLLLHKPESRFAENDSFDGEGGE